MQPYISHLAPGEEAAASSGRIAAPAASQVSLPASAPAPAPAGPAAAAARFIIWKEVRSATGVVSYKVIGAPTGYQVTQTTSRVFGSTEAAKRAAERLRWLKPGAVPSAYALCS